MNMLNCNPKILCKYHLQKEHFNVHEQYSKIIKKEKVELNIFIALNLRHQELVLEQERRGYEHYTPLPQNTKPTTSTIDSDIFSSRRNLYNLLCECKLCFHNYKELNFIKISRSIYEKKRRIYLVESPLDWTRFIRHKVHEIIGPAIRNDLVITSKQQLYGLRDCSIIDLGRPPFKNICYIEDNLLILIDPTFKHLYGGSYI